MNRLATLKQEQLNSWVIQAITYAQTGQLADYIPLLQNANPRWLAVSILSPAGQIGSMGDVTLAFPLMSIIKPFILLYLLSHWDTQSVFERVGIEPSEEPFNSLAQLQADRGWPRNPMINSGAIALASLLPGQDAFSRCETLRLWLTHSSNSQLVLDQSMLASVKSLPNQRNQTIARELAARGYIEKEEVALDTYNHLCCLSGTNLDLAKLGMLLVQCPEPIQVEHCRLVKALMATCGLYQASGRFAVQVGLPTKSGVSGAVLSIVPSQGAIACYSPPLDRNGNSVAGLFLVEQIAKTLDLSIFS